MIILKYVYTITFNGISQAVYEDINPTSVRGVRYIDPTGAKPYEYQDNEFMQCTQTKMHKQVRVSLRYIYSSHDEWLYNQELVLPGVERVVKRLVRKGADGFIIKVGKNQYLTESTNSMDFITTSTKIATMYAPQQIIHKLCTLRAQIALKKLSKSSLKNIRYAKPIGVVRTYIE